MAHPLCAGALSPTVPVVNEPPSWATPGASHAPDDVWQVDGDVQSESLAHPRHRPVPLSQTGVLPEQDVLVHGGGTPRYFVMKPLGPVSEETRLLTPYWMHV